jgi:arabinofuranosyltransferase
MTMISVKRFLPLALFLGLSLLLWKFTIDDNFISYRYARHLADGQGLVWNVGEKAVEGFSNLLWVLILALIGRAGIDIPIAAKIIGFLTGGVIVWILPRFSERVTGSAAWSWVPSLLVSLSIPWILWAVAGGEVMLFSLFFLLLVWGLLEEKSRPVLLSLGCVGMILTRPDGTFYVLAALLSRFVDQRSWSAWFGSLRIPLGLSALAILGLELFRLAYFGDWIPNTLRAKVLSSSPGLPLVGLWFLIALPFLALLIWMYWKGLGGPFPLIVLCVAIINAFAVSHTSIVMNLIQRYHTFLLPVLFAPVPLLLNRVNSRKLAYLLVVGAIGWSATAWPNAYQYVRQERFMCDYRDKVSQSLLSDLPSGSRLGLVDVGIIGYRTGLPIVDMWGLCNAGIAREGPGVQPILRESFDFCLLSVRCSKDSSGLGVTPAFGFDWALVTDSAFNSRFTSLQVLRPDMVGPEPWKFYYVMFARNDRLKR